MGSQWLTKSLLNCWDGDTLPKTQRTPTSALWIQLWQTLVTPIRHRGMTLGMEVLPIGPEELHPLPIRP